MRIIKSGSGKEEVDNLLDISFSSLIASGGIFNAADAKEKVEAGASLVQVWTGFIYEGPGIAKNIVEAVKPN